MRTLFALLFVGAAAVAADPTPSVPPLMTKPGKLLLSDDLTGPLDKAWTIAKGKFEPADGATRGAELKADMHGAVMRRPVDFKDAVIEFSVKLDGAKGTSLSINSSKGHVCRVSVNATGFTVQKDDTDGKNGADKPVVLEAVKAELKPGEWHTIQVEFRGPEMLARLDGKAVGYGQHEAITAAKANVGLTVAGETASFKNLRVWAAEPNPEWNPASLKKAK